MNAIEDDWYFGLREGQVVIIENISGRNRWLFVRVSAFTKVA
jgi:hypothetical protein